MKLLGTTVAFLMLLSSFVFAQKGKLTGKVVDGSTGEDLIGATVVVKETGQGAITDLNGSYQLSLDPGTYTISVSYVSYSVHNIENIEIATGNTQEINVALSSDIELEEIVVQAAAIKDNDVALLKIQKKSLAVQDGISSAEIRKVGASDAAESMTYVTGAAIEGGKYMVMRGLGDRYSLVQMNGLIMPSADPYRNAVSIDLIPTSVVDNITTIKTFLPDNPGNFTGGLVNVTTRSIPSDYYLNIDLSTSYNTVSSFKDNFLLDRATTNRAWALDNGNRDKPLVFDYYPDLLARNKVDQTRNLAVVPEYAAERQILNDAAKSTKNSFLPRIGRSYIDHSFKMSTGNQLSLNGKPLGYNLSLGYDRKFSVFDDFRTGYYAPLNGDSLITDQALSRAQSVEEVQYGGLLSLAYQITPNNEIDFISMYNQNAVTAVDTAYGYWRNPNTDDYHSKKISHLSRTLWNSQLRGRHVFTGFRDARIEWAAGYVYQAQDQPDFRGFGYAVNNGVYTMRTSEIGRLPTHFYRDLLDNQYNFKLDFTLPITSNRENFIKVGGSYSSKNRNFEEYLLGHHREPATLQPGVQNGYTSFTNAAGYLEGYFDLSNYGIVNNGEPGYNTATRRTEYGFGTLVSDQSVLSNNYTGDEIISAGYLMAVYEVMPKVQLIGGVRAEHTNMTTVSADTTKITSGELDDNGNPVFVSRNGNIDKLDLLPSINLKWSLTEKQNLRASFSKTIARPNMREISPFISVGTPEDPQFIGNPKLKRSIIQNYDLRWEIYPNQGELIAVSAYYKKFKDPIVIQNQIQASTPELKPVNTNDANVWGLEFEFRKNLSFISSSLQNFQLGTNFSYIDSRVQKDSVELISIQGTSIENWRPLQGQSPFIVNAILSYVNDQWQWENTVTLNLFGPRLSYVTDALTPDVYEQSRPMMNFVSSKRFGEHLVVGLKVKNLLNVLYLQEFENEKYSFVYESYRSGTSIEASLGFRF